MAGLLNSERVVVGEGICRTLRHAVYQRNGFIEIEIDRPYAGGCGFTKLALVIGDFAIPGPAAVSDTIKTNERGVRYWDDRRGTLFFKHDKPLDPALLKQRAKFGLAEPGCQGSGRCLTDAGLLLAKVDVARLLNEGGIAAAIEKGSYAERHELYQKLKDPRLLDALLQEVSEGRNVDRAIAIHAVESSPKALALADKLARETRRADDLLKVHAINKNRSLLTLAHDAAKDAGEQARVELAVLQALQDKLFDFKVSMSGTGKIDSRDTNALIARVIETRVKSTLSYTGTLRTDIYAPRFNYAVEGVLVLTAKGKLNGERNCGLLWASKCEVNNEDASRSFEYPVSLVFGSGGQYRASGSKEVEWKSVSGGSGAASGLLMGGTLIFKANGSFDMQFKVTSLRLL